MTALRRCTILGRYGRYIVKWYPCSYPSLWTDKNTDRWEWNSACVTIQNHSQRSVFLSDPGDLM